MSSGTGCSVPGGCFQSWFLASCCIVFCRSRPPLRRTHPACARRPPQSCRPAPGQSPGYWPARHSKRRNMMCCALQQQLGPQLRPVLGWFRSSRRARSPQLQLPAAHCGRGVPRIQPQLVSPLSVTSVHTQARNSASSCGEARRKLRGSASWLPPATSCGREGSGGWQTQGHTSSRSHG